MSDEGKKLTTGEAVIVAGKTMIKVGEALDDPNTPEKITLNEWMDIVKTAAEQTWQEWND